MSRKKPSKIPNSGVSNETQLEQNRETVARLSGRILAKSFHQEQIALERRTDFNIEKKCKIAIPQPASSPTEDQSDERNT